MANQAGINKISSIRNWYVTYQLLADVLFAAAISLALMALLVYILHISILWILPVFMLSLMAMLFVHKWWKTSELSIANFLNQQYPELEESSALVLKNEAQLNLLETLQLQKVQARLQEVPQWHNSFLKRIKLALALLLFASVLVWLSGRLVSLNVVKAERSLSIEKNVISEKILPQISAVDIVINPPLYTGKPQRNQDRFTLNIEDGATVTWKISTNIPVKKVTLLFNDKENIDLKYINTDKTQWQIARTINKPGFYQVSVDGKLSDLYQLQIVPDQPPVIRIKSPKQYTYIDAGEAQRVNIDAAINDDYGVSDALIFATVAKGSGEAVKFKEYKLDFGASFNSHQPQYNLQKLVSLPALNMEPGDELYFYIQATDTHQQQSRTDVYTVSIQDTAQLLSMDGMLSGVNQKPEFFRSERQIILDTEKLLKDRDSITTAKFNDRSNDLGIDQKLLRLRYGKFLGEESESDINPADVKDDPVGDIKNYGNAAVILDKYTDKHDNAEDAQFFDPELKKQLKATLTEMWKAELQLRLYKPQDALPFEYKALRLLKDLQQKSRMYVAKTSYNPPALKLEKRLSGDLSKINQPVSKSDIKPGTDQYENLKKAIQVLAQLKVTFQITGTDEHVLALANQQLSLKASAQPGVYLSALSAMRRILSKQGDVKLNDISLVEKAIQKTIAPAARTPVATESSADMGLSAEYYKNLNRLNR
ncbi:DUF4175 family protein [Mucilaginibacter sp. FT3.2]|uniref:DUF4175 family protein n=1 Tax=Mucilaginibacter sp. FT3.2 TaxID=2723090 RepID=UPI0016203890|nr:DUF4175 family protein [Mucilaginibacter sp. FT3.2]MBB6232544.1 hypothetical protein [Mucilaginibacter sp. FT3.2]